MQQDDAICGIDSLFYKNTALGECQLARDEEYHGLLVVSEKIKKIFDKEKITGVWLARPEEFYKGPLTAEDLINDSMNN